MKNKTSFTSGRDQWHEAFPINEAQRAAKFLYDTWEDLVANKPKGFRPTLRENQLTEKFYPFLVRLSQGKGRLTGFWHNEARHSDIDEDEPEDPKVINRIRKDITYTSNADGGRLELIFEFKKLSANNSSWKNYRGIEGMRRFVDGHYAHGLPIALMVGMLMGEADECVKGLKRSLLSKASREDLRMVSRAGDKYIFEPSIVFHGIALFDTEHNRPVHMAPSHGIMLLSHIFVTMPKE